MKSIVSDTTTLIILGKIGRYDLLENIFKKIYIPQEVIKEINAKKDGISKKIENSPLFESKEVKNSSLLNILDGILDKGESQAIVLAKELNLILLIDEKKGRIIAKNMGIEIIGLLGILIINLKKGFISRKEASEILKDIKKTNFRISKKLESGFLEIIGKFIENE